MALSTDQRATLQLVLGRGQSYKDLSELLGVDEDEVRERARSALHELAGADPDRNVGLTDYLLGQSDPIGRADAVRHLKEDVDDRRLAGELTARLREIVPDADLPRLPGEPRAGRFSKRARRDPGEGQAGSEGAGGRRLGARFTHRQSRLLVGLGAAAVLVVAAVLGIAGVFGGGDDGVAATAVENGGDEEVTRVSLSPTEAGGDATGEAVFGLTSADTVFVDLDINRLEPASDDDTYVFWLMVTEEQGYPLTPVVVAPNGSFQERFPIPSSVLPLVARVRFVEVARASNERLARDIQRAQRQTEEATDLGDFLIEVPGRTVLRGEVPVTEQTPGEQPDEDEEDGAGGGDAP
jgi:hypothetical protein